MVNETRPTKERRWQRVYSDKGGRANFSLVVYKHSKTARFSIWSIKKVLSSTLLYDRIVRIHILGLNTLRK